MHAQRKQEHLRICLEEEVRSASSTHLERYHLLPCALPELDLAEVDTGCTFLGHRLAAPLLISAMTGGTPEARAINHHLATAAQALGVAMGLGSQRAVLQDATLWPTYEVREVAPDILLFANLGAVQLNYGFGVAECQRAVEGAGADALVLHLNALQEALQPEGNTNFRGLLGKIAAVCAGLRVPVIVKEVGWGIDPTTALLLQEAGVAALDVAGAGGTSWSEVERHRYACAHDAEVAVAFAGWGLPTAEALREVRAACPALPLIASGGIETGVEVALALALGANLAGMAAPLLRPATVSATAVTDKLQRVLQQLRIAMFCCGAATVAQLDGSRLRRF